MLRILHFSSHYEDCGIAKYQENYLRGMADSEGVKNEFFGASPYQTREMNTDAYDKIIRQLKDDLSNYDVLHIQHEFGFFRGNQLQKMVDAAKESGVKVVVTYHTSPDLIIIKKPLAGLGPRSILSYLRSRRHNNILIDMHIAPLKQADMVLVHNEYTLKHLGEYGVPTEKITLLPHPTYSITHPKKTTYVTEVLNRQKDDVILATVGYIHRFKGVDKAIKALKFLPENYKLAVLGGVKSDSDDQQLYDQLSDLILELGLEHRVHITGVIPSDDDLDSYIREADICVYPYDSSYYKGVSSGALNLAIANERPIVAYPVPTFAETNTPFKQLVLTTSDSYYELAREIRQLDRKTQTKRIAEYAHANSWDVMSNRLIELYRSI